MAEVGEPLHDEVTHQQVVSEATSAHPANAGRYANQITPRSIKFYYVRITEY